MADMYKADRQNFRIRWQAVSRVRDALKERRYYANCQ